MVPLRPVAWLVNLSLVGAVSYGSAAVSMQVLDQRLEQQTPQDAGISAPVQESVARVDLPKETFQRVLDANIFRARRSQVKSDVQPAAPATNGTAPQTAAARKPLSVLLTGTVIMGERAFAMVADNSGRNETLYRLWDCLPAGENHPSRKCEVDQGKLIVVRRNRIIVDYQGERLTFELAEKPAGAVAAVAPTRPSVRSLPRDRRQVPNEPKGAFPITQDGNVLEVRVPNDEVSQAFENFSEVLKQARVVPYTDETGSGFQIRNIRPGSIFERIGLSNFDKIKAVNGEPITTADQALKLLTMFRNEREIVLDLERRNDPIQLNYIIE